MSDVDELAEAAIRAALTEMAARGEALALDDVIVEARHKLAKTAAGSSMELRNRILEAGQAMEARGALLIDDDVVSLA